MKNNYLPFCKCPLGCQEYCYIARQKREAEEAQQRKFLPSYYDELVKKTKEAEATQQHKTPPSHPPIHPLHILWAFVIVLALVFNQQLLEALTQLSKLAR